MAAIAVSHLTVVGAMTLGGYYIGNVARRVNLPSIIGYMLVGVLIGPSVLGALDGHTLEALLSLGILGCVYIAARTFGLIGGAQIGSIIGRVDPIIRKWIGPGILSQAGVAIGLSIIIQRDFTKLADLHPEAFAQLASNDPLPHPLAIGFTVITTITATCIVFKIVGPLLTKVALKRAGEINQAPEM